MQRLVQCQGLTLPDKEAHWWAVYLRQFFRYARERGERMDAAPLVRDYLREFAERLPAEKKWQAQKAGRVLDVLLGGIENWRWVEEAEGRLSPKFRLKKGPASPDVAV